MKLCRWRELDTARNFPCRRLSGLVERAFGKRRLFADSPTARALGFGVRIGDPALPLLKPEARLDRRSERLLRADILRALPDPKTRWDAPPNGHLWIRQGLGFLALIVAVGGVSYYIRRRVQMVTLH
ncbi:MAG: hypothetical protein WB586_19210 [Chthoniobacterales bacterium]